MKVIPLGTASVGRNNHGIAVTGNLVLDVLDDERRAMQVVNGNVKKPLKLWIVQVHGNQMMGALMITIRSLSIYVPAARSMFATKVPLRATQCL